MTKRRREKFDDDRKNEFLSLLKKGIRRTRACEKVGITRKTFNDHLNKDDKFKSDVLQAEMDANELVESAMFKSAMAGNVTAQQVWLYNRMPDQWADRRNIGKRRSLDIPAPEISLQKPEDIRRVCGIMISSLFNAGIELENPQTVTQIMKAWMEAFGLEKIETLEKKIAEIEKEREKK